MELLGSALELFIPRSVDFRDGFKQNHRKEIGTDVYLGRVISSSLCIQE